MTCSTAFGRLGKAQRVRRFDGSAKTVRAPQADECAAAKLRPQPGGSYSITSSGLASSVGGTARPSAFAVLSGLKFVRSLVGLKKVRATRDGERRMFRGVRHMPLAARIISTFFLLSVSCLLSSAAKAEVFANRPIWVNVSFASGAPQDLVMRAIAEIAFKDLGQPILIDNKPAAAATLAAAITAKPDGYTIGTAVSTLVLVPQMQKVAFDPFKDFTYIQQLAAFPIGVTVKTESSFKSWADVIAHAKANPGVVTYGTPGPGTNVHLGMERVQKHAGKLTHVPHTGAVSLIPAVLGGHIMSGERHGMEAERRCRTNARLDHVYADATSELSRRADAPRGGLSVRHRGAVRARGAERHESGGRRSVARCLQDGERGAVHGIAQHQVRAMPPATIFASFLRPSTPT